MVSLSNHELNTNGLGEQHWVNGVFGRICLLNDGLLSMLIVASIFEVGVVVAAFICRNGFYFTFRLTAGGIWSHMDERE